MKKNFWMLSASIVLVLSFGVGYGHADPNWRRVSTEERASLYRMKVPGGWLVRVEKDGNLETTFIAGDKWTVTETDYFGFVAGRFIRLTTPQKSLIYIGVEDIVAVIPASGQGGSAIIKTRYNGDFSAVETPEQIMIMIGS